MAIEMHCLSLGDDVGGDDSRMYWYVFPRDMRNRKITRKLAGAGYPIERESCQHAYDCCGQVYGGGLTITRRGSRALATITVTRNV